MRHSIRYIFALACAVAFSACSKEYFEGFGQNETIEFIMRPTTFSAVDVARPGTKAEISEVDRLAAETAIHSLYFLVFDADGAQIGCKSALTNGIPTSQNLKSEDYFKKFPLTICYIANVTESFAKSIKNISDLSTKTLDIEYSTFEKTAGIPIIDKKNVSDPSDDLLGFPMIGKVTYPNTEVTGPQVVVPLERLFAKVTIKVKVDIIKSDLGVNLDPPSFDISTYILHNLPKKVCLGNALSEDGTVLDESSWVDNEDAFEGPLEGEINKIILDEAIDLGNTLDILPEEVLTFYVPEYALEPEELNTAQDQKIKPSLYDPDKHPIYVTLNGIISQEEFEDAPVSYNIHLGENPYDSFSLRRNIWYTYNMYINGTVDAFIGADLRVETEPFNLADPGRTGTDNPANCYIISKPGRYLLPTYIGNDVAGGTISNAEECEIIDINGDAINTISNVDVIQKNGKDYVVFNANVSITDGVASLNDVKGGNKLLAIKDASGNVLWSWHLWFCEDAIRPDLDESMHKYPTENGTWNGKYVMNRALGATSAITLNNLGLGSYLLEFMGTLIGLNLSDFVWQDGLYYQWGRKDPMTSAPTTGTGASHQNSVLNPSRFYTDWNNTMGGWSDQKTINDPCPPGYKVPASNIWRNTNSDAEGFYYDLPVVGNVHIPTSTETAYTYNLTNGETENSASGYIFYPYPGYLGTNGNLISSYDVKEPLVDNEYKFISNNALIEGLSTEQHEYTNFNMTVDVNVKGGALWGTSTEALSYSYGTTPVSELQERITIVSAQRRTRTRRYMWNSWGAWSSPTTVNGGNISTTDKALMLIDLVLNATDTGSYGYDKIKGDSKYAASGLQVRCVRE